MSNNMTTSVIVSLSKNQKSELRKIAATRNLANLDGTETLSSLVREAIEQFLAKDSNDLNECDLFKMIEGEKTKQVAD